MSDYSVLLENPRRRRRRRKSTARKRRNPARRRAAPRRRRRTTSRRRRRNPSAVMVNPRRRRRRSTRRRSSRRRNPSRRRRNPFGLGAGNMRSAFRGATQMLLGEFAGDALSRIATKFGIGKLFAAARVPAAFTLPATRLVVGLVGPRVLKMAPRLFKPQFRDTFAAVNIATALITLTNNVRTRVFQSAGLAGYELADWETASDGVGLLDWETANDGVGMLGTPPAGVFDYDDGADYADFYNDVGGDEYGPGVF